MASDIVTRMVGLVEKGNDPKHVLESSLSYGPGSSVKVNKATTGTDPQTGGSVSIPEGTLVTILGIGGGDSGSDHHAQLQDGRQVIIPFADLGESFESNDDDLDEDLTGSVVQVVLSKPLPDGAVSWLEGGFMDYGVQLPSEPMKDDSGSVTFLMKADDKEMLDSALEVLKREAGASFKSSKDASLTDWTGI